MPQVDSTIQDQVKRFKRTVLNSSSSLVSAEERAVVRDIPDSVFERIFVRVFSGDEKLARNVLFKRFDDIDFASAQKVVDSINTLSMAADIFALSVASNTPMLLISDIDNDGDLAQAIMMQAKRISGINVSVQPRDYNPSEHGFTNEQIRNWMNQNGLSDSDEFTVFVADLGTNQLHRQQEFAESFPNASLVIADHHTPDLDKKVHENIEGRCLLVSPFNKGSLELGVRKGGGVSGSYLLSRTLQMGLRRCVQAGSIDLEGRDIDFLLEPLEKMGAAANLFDQTDSDIRLKPIRPDDVDKMNTLSSDVRAGKGVVAFIRDGIEDDIEKLRDLVGDIGVKDLMDMKDEALALNHYAWALHSVLPSVVSPDYTGNIADDVIIAMESRSPEESRERNYLQLVRPYYYHFGYDNIISKGPKSAWADLVKYNFRQVSKTEKNMLAFIRNYEMVEEISHDHVLMTRPAHPEVKNVFTPKQLNTAYHTQGKSINLEMRSVRPGSVVLGIKSDISLFDVLKNVRQTMPDVKMQLEGHKEVGALTLSYPQKESADSVIRKFASALNDEAAVVIANKPVVDGIEVTPLHLTLMHELMTNMCLHIDSSAAPELIMRVDPTMTFEDSRTLRMETVEELVEKREWETTVEPLTFSMDLSLLLPNQALKGVANDGYNGALGIKMMSNGAFMADKVFLGDQLKHIPLTKLRTPDDKLRQVMIDDYENYFKDRELPLLPIPEEVGGAAIKFVEDGLSVHRNTKKIAAAQLVKTGCDTYVGFDKEANGGANAKAYNLGMLFMSIDGERRPVITEEQLRERLAKGDVPSILEKRADGSYVVEPKIKSALLSLIVNFDGDKPIRISFRSQGLTNMDQGLVDYLGSPAGDVQDKILKVLSMMGKCVFQAHNIIYDEGIARVNFPEFYNFIDKSIQLDSAPLAKNTHLAYFNLLTAVVDKVAFANTPGSSTSLTEMLKRGEDFSIPSVKGTHVLQVKGEKITMRKISSGLEGPLTKEDMTPAELLKQVENQAIPLPSPRYGIDLLMRMSSIHEMLSNKANKQRTFVDYEQVGGMPALPDKLWRLFQQNFAFDRTVNENIEAFLEVPGVVEHLGNDAIDVNVGDMDAYSPDIQALIAQKLSVSSDDAELSSVTISSRDLLRRSALKFTEKNSQIVDLFSNSWIYERVLNYYEPTNKRDVTQGLMKGVESAIGVPVEFIAQVYEDAFVYRNDRGISSYRCKETHNNVNTEGDTFQEVHAYAHLMYGKYKNPFLTDDVIVEHGLTPFNKINERIHEEIALSTLNHDRRHVVDLMMDTDVINSYGAKQLDDFSKQGISIAAARDGVASMKCKSISADRSRVDIDFPQLDAKEWRALDDDSRFEIEQRVETAVSMLLVVNSMDKKKMTGALYSALNKITHNPMLKENISWVNDNLGVAIPNDRKQSASDWLGEIAKAMISGNLKLKMNKHMTDDDLTMIANTFEKSFDKMENMGYLPAISKDTFLNAITVARFQYKAFEMTRKTGESPDDVPGGTVKGPLKAQITRLVKAMAAVSPEHKALNPSLVSGVVTKKKSPSSFVLTSPLITEHIKNTLKIQRPEIPEKSLNVKLKK